MPLAQDTAETQDKKEMRQEGEKKRKTAIGSEKRRRKEQQQKRRRSIIYLAMQHNCILIGLSSSKVVQDPAGQLGELGDGTGGLQVDHFEEGASDSRG